MWRLLSFCPMVVDRKMGHACYVDSLDVPWVIVRVPLPAAPPRRCWLRGESVVQVTCVDQHNQAVPAASSPVLLYQSPNRGVNLVARWEQASLRKSGTCRRCVVTVSVRRVNMIAAWQTL